MANTSNYLILFGDLVGSTEVAAELDPQEYANTYMASFRWAASCAYKFVKAKNVFPGASFKTTISSPVVTGDEVFSFTNMASSSKSASVQDLVASAVAFAYATKLCWLASPYNVQRMLRQQFPRDIAFGLHIGPAAKVPCGGKDMPIASLHINVAKRIESSARSGRALRIFASRDVADLYAGWQKRMQGALSAEQRPPLLYTKFQCLNEPVEAKGLPVKLRIRELALARELLGQARMLAETPDTEDISAERATRILGEMFLLSKGYPFAFGGGKQAVIHSMPNACTATQYVDTWFTAVKTVPGVFMDDPAQVLSCYFMSCAFMRHRKAKRDKTTAVRYRRSAQRGLDLLDALLQE